MNLEYKSEKCFLELLNVGIISYSFIGGFYLPISYSVVLNRVGVLHRGVACGALDMVELISLLFATIFLLPFELGDWQTLLLFLIIYLLAAVIQKFASSRKIMKGA